MMSEKAKRFGDTATSRDIVSSSDPAQQKRLGRSVSNFNQGLWVRPRYDIVYKGNLAKCSTPPFRQQLLDTLATRSSPKPALPISSEVSASGPTTGELSNLSGGRALTCWATSS